TDYLKEEKITNTELHNIGRVTIAPIKVIAIWVHFHPTTQMMTTAIRETALDFSKMTPGIVRQTMTSHIHLIIPSNTQFTVSTKPMSGQPAPTPTPIEATINEINGCNFNFAVEKTINNTPMTMRTIRPNPSITSPLFSHGIPKMNHLFRL